LHRKFMKTSDSDYSSDDEPRKKKAPLRKISQLTSESQSPGSNRVAIHDPTKIGTVDGYNQANRNLFKVVTSTSTLLNSQKHKVQTKLQNFKQLTALKEQDARKQALLKTQVSKMAEADRKLSRVLSQPHVQTRLFQDSGSSTLSQPQSPVKKQPSLPSIQDIKTVVNSFNFLNSAERKGLT